jgi:hypothetical protein
MDVLKYWTPGIDWAQFEAGPISDNMWAIFRQFVELCHAYHYWRKAMRNQVMVDLPESKDSRKKRQREWRAKIDRCETRMKRAAFLADEKISEMSWLIGEEDKGKPDWILWRSLRLASAYPADATAFEEFDANQELQSNDPLKIANHWLVKAGYGELPENLRPE